MDIEERAEKWARDNWPDEAYEGPYSLQEVREACAEAYLAGSAQTQADYVAHYGGGR